MDHGCAGQCIVRGSINKLLAPVVGTGTKNNDNRNEVKQAAQAEELLHEAQAGDTLRLDFISYLYPCTYDCRSDIPFMTGGLLDIAGDLEISLEMHW